MRMRMFYLGPQDTEAGGVDEEKKSVRYTKEEVMEASKFCGVELNRWCFRVSYIYAALLITAIVFIPLQNKTTLTKNNRKLQTPLTQTVGVWAPSSLAQRSAGISFGGNLFLSGHCPIYDGVNFTDSNTFIRPVTLAYSSLDSRYIVLGCLISAFVFQLFGSFKEEWYVESLRRGNNHLGSFIERSFSVSIMMVAMCAQMGMTDLWTLLNIMFNTWAAMLFCFFAEVLFQEEHGSLALWDDGRVHYHAIAMVAAWLTLSIAVCGLYSHIAIVDTCFSVVQTDVISQITTSVVYIELFLLAGMLFFQTLSQYFKAKPGKAENNPAIYNERIIYTIYLEYAYLWLDLLSKVTFCVLIYTDSLLDG